VEDIANGLGMHPNEVVKYIETLRSSGRIVESRVGGKTYYRAPT